MLQLNDGRINFSVFQRFLRIFLGWSKILHQSQLSSKFKNLQFNAFYGLKGSIKAKQTLNILCVFNNILCIFKIGNWLNNMYFEIRLRAPRAQNVRIQSGRTLEIIYKPGLLQCPCITVLQKLLIFGKIDLLEIDL